MGHAKRFWYLSPMRAAKVQASLRIRAVSPELSLLAHTSSESRGTFRQKARSVAPLNGWACAVEICHDGMLEDTNSLGGAHMEIVRTFSFKQWAGKNKELITMAHLCCSFCTNFMFMPRNNCCQCWLSLRINKEIEDIWVFQCKIEFYFTEWKPQAVFSRVAVAIRGNTDCGVHE